MARRVWVLLAVLLSICTVHEVNGQNLPAGPSRFVDTTYPTQTGTTFNVPAGGDFQGTLNQAQLGDTITLAAGSTYSGNFTLPAKSGNGWIIIRTSAPDSSLPAQGHRITPSYSSSLPKIVTTNSSPALKTALGAHHYRLVGLELTVSSGVANFGIVVLDDGNASTLSQIPSNIVLDRVYIHGQPNDSLRRGVAMNSATTAIIDSYISDVHEAGADTQAIACWNGPGPFKITNNYLEAAGENVIFGGADPAVTNLVPSDIEIRGNYFFKPTAWRSSSWTVKNILELKNAQRVLVDGNVLEHNWPQAQNGYSILFTVRNQSGGSPWSVVQDITFTHNIVRHVSSAINMHGTDDLQTSQQTYRILISNNVFEDVSDVNWGGFGNLVQVIRNPIDVTVEHNTAFPTNADLIGGGTPTTHFIFRNSICAVGRWGVAGDFHYGDPLGALNTYFPGAVFTKNAMQGGSSSQYPAGNFFPPTMNDVGFVNFAGGDYHLNSTSPYKSAGTDGKDLGADIDSVNSATSGAVSGNSTPPPPPPPPPPSDTTPPTVSITAPANGATVSGTTTVTANASDNVGVVGVQFYLDGSPLGAEDTASPWSTSWDTTRSSNGGHSLTARARDAAGNNTTSAAVSVTVSNSAPPPGTQQPFYGTPFAVPGRFEAEDFDKGGEGIAYHDNVPGNAGGLYRTTEDVDIISPYAGGYAVNNFETGEWMEYTINVTASGSYRIEALVSSALTGQFHVEIDGVNKTGAVNVPNTGSWTTFQWFGNGGISLTAGQHVLRLSSDIQYFNVDALRVTQETDTTPPAVSITAPSNGATVSGTTTVTASASDNVGVVGVQFFVDGAALGAEDTTAPYSTPWDTTTSTNGSHSLTATARDAAGNRTTSAAVTVTVSNSSPDTTPPTVSITAPSNGATVANTIPVNASASDNVGVVGVQFFLDGSNLGAEDTSAPYSISWDTTQVANGSHSLTATARDAAGNRTTSAAVTVTVSNSNPDTTPPTVSITAPPNGATVAHTIPVTASASDNVGVVGVQFYVDGAPLGAEDTTAPYSISWDTTQSANGSHTLTARARDAAGNQKTSTAVNVIVSNTPPVQQQQPFTGTPFSVPGRFEAEDFDKGGEGIAYHDNTAGNAGGLYRTTEDVDIISPYAGGYVVNNFQTGEWMEYTINVTASGSYLIEALVSSMYLTSQFHVSIDDVDKTGLITTPNTGAWTTFQWAGKGGISLTAGQHVLRLTSDVEYTNVDALRLTLESPASPPPPDTTAPSVAITAPSNGAMVFGIVEIDANASDNVGVVGVQFFVDGAVWGAEDTAAPFSVSWDTTIATNATHMLTATARDAAGNSTTSAAVQVTVANIVPDTTAPSVAITAPANGATVSATVQVTASASDNIGVAGVQFYLDGAALGAEVTAAPYSVSWNTTTAANGSHALTAAARDAAGNNTTSIAVQVTVSNGASDTIPPTAAIFAPSNGATVSGTVQVAANASDNIGVVGVQFYLDGVVLGAEDTVALYSVLWDTTKTANGTHTLTAVARDAAGNTATSSPISVTVSNAAPRRRPGRH